MRSPRFAVYQLIFFVLLITLTSPDSVGQGVRPDTHGHCLRGSASIFACWNFKAGENFNENNAPASEPFPNLRGWDFRINLPHVRFQKLRDGGSSAVSMVGVIEDATPMDLPAVISADGEYGHRSNSIWLFRPQGGRVLFSQLPSRRDFSSNRVENARSLEQDWFRVGPSDSPSFQSIRVSAVTSGRGLNAARVHVIAVDDSFRLWHNSLLVDRTNITSWTEPWRSLNISSKVAPSLVKIDDDSLVLAWVGQDNTLRARTFDVSTNTWSAPVTIASSVDPHSPIMVLDGVELRVFFTRGDRLLHSSRAFGFSLAFTLATTVSSTLPVSKGQFDAIAFNSGVHLVVRTPPGPPLNNAVFYMTNTSRFGSQWTIPSDTGLKAIDTPRIGTLNENVFVVATGLSGHLNYSRKDPNSTDNRITGQASSDRWLDAGLDVDPQALGRFASPELLTFNSDLYLTANRTGINGSAEIMNFGRAAMKELLTSKWSMNLLYGGAAHKVQPGPFGAAGQIRLIGDFDGNRKTDLIRFAQTSSGGGSSAPVFVKLVNRFADPLFSGEQLWHSSFSPKGEIPLVGDFNGDGKDDIVSFHQQPPVIASASLVNSVLLIDAAPVRVAISKGTAFADPSVWQPAFSHPGEIPLVGDFDGDGKKDIVNFSQKTERNPDGSLIGAAPVRVALSTGQSFGQSQVWHTSFSLQGEVPMVGDFNGDGKDDIANFVQKPQIHDDLALQAPVLVALSNGTSFGESRVWIPAFARKGELPRVADLNVDGKADVVTFLQGTGSGLQARNVLVALSTGARFESPTLFSTSQIRKDDLPSFGAFTGTSLAKLTNDPNDAKRLIPDLYVFEPDGITRLAVGTYQIPFSTGAPWERYKWFTEKGLGAALFPEWIYRTGPNHCLHSPFSFVLGGAGGSGGASRMISSVRSGGRSEHILEEMGHSLFANCLRSTSDPFKIFDLIYETPMSQGGLDASNLPGCKSGFDDCRDREHFFLGLLKRYRLSGDKFRDLINNDPSAIVRNRRRAQYLWLKEHWYRGAEFKSGPSRDPLLRRTYGLLCLPGECKIVAPA